MANALQPDPQQAQPQTQPQESMMDVFNQNGDKGKIPMSQWPDARQSGYKAAVRVTDQNGKGGWVPSDQAGAALKDHGYKLGPPEQQPGYSAPGTPGVPAAITQANAVIIDAVKSAPQFGMSLFGGLKRLAFYDPSKGETPNNSGPEIQIAKPMVQAGQQAIDLYKQNQPVKATVTALAAVNPFAAGPVSQINELQAQGKDRDARSAAILNSLLLSSGTGPGRAALSDVLDATRSGVDTASRLPAATKAAFTQTAAQKLGSAIKPEDVGSFQNAAANVLPEVHRAATSRGVNQFTLESVLDSISQAKEDVLRQHEATVGHLGELPPDQAANLNRKMQSLNTLQQGLQAAQDKINAPAAPAQPTPMAGLFHRLPVLQRAVQARTLADVNAGIQDAFSRVSAAQAIPNAPAEAVSQAAPFTGDTTVQHQTNIYPPETPHGEAPVFPDVPNPRFQLSSSSTATLNPQLADILQRARQAAPGTVTTLDPAAFTSVPQGVTPELPARQLPLGQAAPQPNATASLMQTLAQSGDPKLAALGQTLQQKIPPTVDAEIPQGNGMNIGPRPDRFKPIELQPSGAAELPQDIEAWLKQQENIQSNSPMMKRVRDAVQRRREAGDLPAGIRPTETELMRQDAQIREMIYEANAQAQDSPGQFDLIDQILRRQNKQPRPFEAGNPLKTSPATQQGILTPQVPTEANTLDLLTKSVQQAQSTKTIAQSLAPLAEAKPIDPTSPVAAQLSALRDELMRTTDPAQRADIQQAISRYQAIATGQPFHAPEQATVENLAEKLPRTIDPGTYNRETKTTTPPPSGKGPTVMFPVKDISVKPSVMQFRTDADPITGEKIGRNIGGVQFDQELAGPVRLWRDPQTGDVLLGDGHHRLALAKRSGVENIEARFMDVPTVEAARARAAFSNIAEGNASLFDAAKFLRDSGITPEQLAQKNISLQAGIAQDALSLSKLDNSLFDKVRTGELGFGDINKAQKWGAIIGEASADPAIQESIFKEMQSRNNRGRSLTDNNVAELAKLAKQSGTQTTTTMDLFGGHQETTGLLGEFADAASQVQKDLASRKSTFGAVAKEGRARTLASVEGQNIVPGANALISSEAGQLAEIFDKVSMSPGPVNDMLMKTARQMANMPPREAKLLRESASPFIIDELRKMLPAGSQLPPTGGLNVAK